MMTETKFTPGPWLVDENVNVYTGDPTIGERKDIADTYGMGGFGNCEANANLIAAAPDLYAVVDAFEMYYPMGINADLDDAVLKARAALSKAWGEA